MNGNIEPGYYWVKLKEENDNWVIGHFRESGILKEWSVLDRWPLYEPEQVKLIGPRIDPPNTVKVTYVYEVLKDLVAHVRHTRGTDKAINFYVDYIQPLKEYFSTDETAKIRL